MLEYVPVAGIVGEGYSIEGGRERGERSETVAPNTTDRSVVNHPKNSDLYLDEDLGNGGGEGSYSLTNELDRTAPLWAESELYRLHATLAASGYGQVPGSE